MNQDFVEMLSVLSGTGTEFLVVGAHALAVLLGHAQPGTPISGFTEHRRMRSAPGARCASLAHLSARSAVMS